MTITYADPAEQPTTTVTISGKNITVTPGTKARMIVTGTLSVWDTPYTFPAISYNGISNGKPAYGDRSSYSNDSISWTTSGGGSSWVLNAGGKTSSWASPDNVASPDIATWETGDGNGGGGTPTITAATSSASQVIDAVAANPTAAALLSGALASGNDGTGAVTAMATLRFFSAAEERKFVTTWKTDNPGKTSSTQITIPTNPGINPNTGSKFVYNYKVEWGDGTSDSDVTGDKVHTYATAGTYTVSISGTFPSFNFKEFNSWADRKNESDSMKLLTVEEWGTNAWQSFENAFQSCENLVINATDAPNLTAVKSMKNMFMEAKKFNQPIGHWNVSNVIDMEGLFQNAATFNQDLS